MRTVQVKADICDDKYFNLFQIKGEVDKIYSLALENNMEREVIEEWRQLQIFVNVLLEGLKNKSHSEAIKELKLVFGGSRGLDDEHSKLARKILRQSGSASGPLTPWAPAPHMNQMPQMNFTGFGPPPMFSQAQGPMLGQMPGQNAYSGHCYNCGDFGHMQRDCPMPRAFQGSFQYQGRSRRGGGRSFGGARNSRDGRRGGRN